MDVLFLDANVLFSAAYRPDAGLRRLWHLPRVKLGSSHYAVEEARRNLEQPRQRADLAELLRGVVLTSAGVAPEHPAWQRSALPEKDRPILLAALAVDATHLITGDVQHFGRYFGRRLEGILVLPPGQYLRVAAHAESEAGHCDSAPEGGV